MDHNVRARRLRATALVAALAGIVALTPSASRSSAASVTQAETPTSRILQFFRALAVDEHIADAALVNIADAWKPSDAAMVIDLAGLMQRANRLASSRSTRVIAVLEKQTGQSFGGDLSRWRDWLWSRPYDPPPGYSAFKRALYGRIDPRFEAFFRDPLQTSIRLDRVDWGGVGVNGIPPLDHPRHITGAEATYLGDDNIVFGVSWDGVARAYPKRILAWHELARDRVGNHDITLVYCTLCGTVIPYDSHVGGLTWTFGTSGLLYLSNKLMFDAETNSLWSSLEGAPVVGPLVGRGLHLTILPVVTTTWGEWRREHPETTALSLDTGFSRDYSEGAAYRDYFATDTLMFQVPRPDVRLKNKAEVLVLRPRAGVDIKPLAIAADFLLSHRVHGLEFDGRSLVVVTTPQGANRVYESGTHLFHAAAEEGRVLDEAERSWIVEEGQLRGTFDPSRRLSRVPAHRAFWFGWYAQHPETLLVR